MTRWTLCIDFGTAYSKAAVAPQGAWSAFDPANLRPLMLNAQEQGGNPFLLDSAIFIDGDRVFFGRAAIARADALASRKRLPLKSFKTLLSVSDLDRALNTNAPASVDPNRIFQMRDLVVLYLAYLLACIGQALSADPVLREAEDIAFRYAAPAWRRGDSAGMHETIVRLFAEGEAFRAAAGKRLLAPEGLAVDAVAKMLPKSTESARSFDMGLIFEAAAAAAYTSIGLEDAGTHLIVVDMGAGTTDMAALARSSARLVELPEARVTLKQAGDFIDQVIANRTLELGRGENEAALWAAVMRRMRDLKETLFADGQVIFRYEGRNIKLNIRDVERDRDFKVFLKTLTEAYDHGLDVVRGEAMGRGANEVQAIAVGGGAAAPFIQTLIRRGMNKGRLRVTPRPATPDWAHSRAFGGNLAPVFPQLAISIGGALAPESMLAARAGFSPAVDGQTDIPAGRD